MSEDPTRPLPSGRPRPPDPRGRPGGSGDQGGQRDDWGQSGRSGGGAPGGQGDWGAQRDQGGWGTPGDPQGYGGPGDPRGYGGPGDPRGYGGPGDPRSYGGQGGYGGPGGPQSQGEQGDWSGQGGGQNVGRGPRPRRRHRGLTITAVVVVVLLILLVVADRVAAGIAENEAANQIKSAGFPVKPKVTISGFPFLTQLASRDFRKVNISASNVKEGPVDIASINATGQGVHLTSSFNGATVDQINGTALVTFAGLSSAAGLGDGITLSNAGDNKVKATINLGFVSGDAIAQVTKHGSHQIEVKVTDAGPIPLSVLGNLADFTVSLPNLPAGMTVQSVSVTDQGVLISISGSNTSFGG
jgi:LmeA-like phospholipid-binding